MKEAIKYMTMEEIKMVKYYAGAETQDLITFRLQF